MTNPTTPLITAADDWARSILLDSYTNPHTDQLVQGWAQVMRSAAQTWDAVPGGPTWQSVNVPGGYPFRSVTAAATQIAADATWWQHSPPDPRAAQITNLFDHAADSIQKLRDGVPPTDGQLQQAAELRAGLLHVSYVLTHAAATGTARTAAQLSEDDPARSEQVSMLNTRILGVEQILDAHLRRAPYPSVPPTQIDALDQTLNTLARHAYEVQSRANPATNLVLADIGRDLTGNTGRLAIQSTVQGRLPVGDLQDRLLPALGEAVQQWTASRYTWVRLMDPRQDRPDPQSVTIGNQLRRQLRAPGLADHPAIHASMTIALNITTELAVLNHCALTNPDLQAPGGSVGRFTQDVINSGPNRWNHLTNWYASGPAAGPNPVPLPEALRGHLAQQGQATLDAALTARSAGNVLADRSGYQTLALHQGQSGAKPHGRPEAPSRDRPGPDAPRIG